MTSDPREIELKIDLDPAALRRVRNQALKALSAQEIARERLTSTYFDTKTLFLHKRGLSLRIRVAGDRRVQTLKGDSLGGGVFDRLEWNVEIGGDEPDLTKIDQAGLRDALQKRLSDRLRPVFKTEVDRTIWTLGSEAAEIEVALDEGQVIAGDRIDRIAELELELKRGLRSELFAAARSLVGPGGLKLGVMAKSERGYWLMKGEDAAFFKADSLFIEPASRTEDAFKAVVRSCIRHFRLNEPLLVQTRAAEPLHQCRVALRRLRSAFSLFKDMIVDDEVEGLRERLRVISQDLGEARDLDVFLAKLCRPQDETVSHADASEFAEQIRNNREQAYDRVLAALQGTRSKTLMFDVLAWAEAGPWLTNPNPVAQAIRRKPVESFATEILERRMRRIRKRGRHLEDLSPPARHKVRIEAKKLRYASEFFASLASTKKKRRRQEAFSTALAALQDHLGELNDIATSDKFTKGLPQEVSDRASDRESSDGIDTALGGSKNLNRLLKAAIDAFHDIEAAKPFWDAPGSKRGEP